MRHPLRRDPHDAEILRLALPALGALMAEPLYVLADTAVVGHLGTEPLAGLAVASSILLIGYSLFIFLAYGTTASVARLLGAGEERRAAHEAVQGMWLAVLVGVALAVAGYVLAEPLVSLVGAGGTVRTEALTYLRISLLGMPAMLVVLAGTGYLRGLQNTRTPLLVAVCSAAFNLGLELVLIAGLGFAIGASALSTVIAQWGSAAVYVLWVRRAVRRHAVPLRPDPSSLRRLAVVGRDLFVRTAALRGAFLLATVVATRIGSPDVAAHQIAFEIWNLLALALDALAIAGQALTGRFLGADEPHLARAAAGRMIELSVLIGVVLGAGIFLARGPLPEIFTSDPLVLSLTSFLLVFVAIMQPLNGFVFALDGILIGAGDLGYLAWAMVVAVMAFAPAAVGVLLYGGGIGWLWGALMIFMGVRALTLGLRFAGEGWVVVGPDRSADRLLEPASRPGTARHPG
ncbi:MATE family efflux transporter [Rhabdothermincola sp.]|uniref:MATE family efflux transporter n=1 Tax=Rhabdothermincola sp. TaxID=2820405 RepID=UPI002FE2D111